jgi:MFS family permease
VTCTSGLTFARNRRIRGRRRPQTAAADRDYSTAACITPGTGTALAPLRHRAFRLLWAGQSVSAIGDRLAIVALVLLVAQTTHAAADVGLVVGLQGLALVVGLPLGGVIADRLPRHRLMLAADLMRFVLQGTLAALIFAGSLRLWEIVAIVVAYGLAQAAFQPSYSGLIPQTVDEADIQQATALTQGSRYAAIVLGPALAALVATRLNIGVAFAIDALTFLCSAALLCAVRPRRRGPETSSEGVVADLLAGLRAVRQRRWVWMTIAAFSIIVMVAAAPYTVLGPFIVTHAYGSAAVFALITAAIGAGTLCGAVLAMRWRPRRRLRTGLLAATSSPALLISLALGSPLALVTLIAVIAGAGLALFAVWWEATLAEAIPPHLLSRVAALDWMGSLALLPFAYLATGALAPILGSRETLLLAAFLGLAALAAAATAMRTPGSAPEERATAGALPSSVAS